MQANPEAVADILAAVFSGVASAFWLMFGTPVILWSKPPIVCGTFCYPTAGPFAVLSVVLLLWIVLRLFARGLQRRNIAWCLFMFAIYLGLPSFYDGLRRLEYRSQQLQSGR